MREHKKISASVVDQLPFYLKSDEDYQQFVHFIELYYKWLESDRNPAAIGNQIENFSDLDETLDIFVDEYQNVLAKDFPQFSRIKDREELTTDLRAALNFSGDSDSKLEYIEYDNYLSGGVNSVFPLSYYSPVYYEIRDFDTSAVEIKVYSVDASSQSGTSGLADLLDEYTFPTDYTLLTEGTDYVLDDSNKEIKFVDPSPDVDPGTLKPLPEQTIIKIAYHLRKKSGVTQEFINKKYKKTKYSNKKLFLKLMKEFYQSKGSESSYQFLFRSLFNEDVEFYYPKDNIMKPSDNTWVEERSVRTIPSNKTVSNPVRIVGKTSGASATVERFLEFSISDSPVREYFVTHVFGTFTSREEIEILMSNGVTITETLYDCIVGFDIDNGGSNYPNNFYLNQYISDPGDGVGLSAKISNTSKGPVEAVEIISGGSNYITGEQVSIGSYGSGSAASAYISAVEPNEFTTETVSWVQDEDNPSFYYSLSDYPSIDYSDSYSRDRKVTISNTDHKWDDVLIFLDFENVHENGSGFVDSKFEQESFRYGVNLINPAGGPKWGSKSAKGENGYILLSDLYKDHLKDSLDSFSVDFWIYPDDINGTDTGGTLFALNDVAFNANSIRIIEEGSGTAKTGNLIVEISGTEYTAPVPVDWEGQWNHISLYVSETEIKLHINGERKILAGGFIQSAPTRQTVFNTWNRFSHNSSGTYPANAGETTAFVYNSANDTIVCTANTSTYVGFYSLESEKFSEYDFSATISSTSTDDDTIGLVIAFVIDDDGKEHTLSLLRAQGGMLNTGGYQVVYNYLQADQVVVFNGNSLAPAQSGGWAGLYSRLRAIRNGDTFTTSVSQFTTSVETDNSNIDVNTEFTFSLSELVDDGYSWASLFSGSSQWGYACHSQDASTWSNILFNGLNGEDAYTAMFESLDSYLVTLGSSLSPSGSYYDYNLGHYSSFRVTSDERYTEYTSSGTTYIKSWELDPIQNFYSAYHITKETNRPAQYYFDVVNDRLVIFKLTSEPDVNNWTDNSSFASTISSQIAQYGLAAEPFIVPDNWTVKMDFINHPHGPIVKIDVYSGGDGYEKFPFASISNSTSGYNSIGTNAILQPKGSNIGSISEIKITNSPDSASDGFGVGYTVAPTIDLSTLGDGNAQITPILGPLLKRDGFFFNDKGFLSDENRIQDGYLWQDYSYVLRTSRNIDQWRYIVKKLLHPSGLMMFGEVNLISNPEPKKLQSLYLQFLFEIVKNADVSVKNMDGLGRWTGSDSTPINVNDLLSHGYTFVYDNYQTGGPMSGVGDDTPVGQTVDTGDGRYKLLDVNRDPIPTASNWSEIKYVLVNVRDENGLDLTKFYTENTVQRNFTIYDIDITDETTRPFAKFKVIDTTHYENDLYVEFEVTHLTSFGVCSLSATPGDKVEFRWDKVFRGNVERVNRYWVGAIRDGADPRDEKFVIMIDSIGEEVPSLSNQYRSLDRIKFRFDREIPFEKLVRYRFSSEDEAELHPQKKTLAGIVRVQQNPNGEEEYGYVTSRNPYSSLESHEFYEMIWGQIVDSYDRGQNINLDSEINVYPKIMRVTTPKDPNNRLNSGMNYNSVERMKFNQTPQSIDNELYLETIENIENKSNIKTNIAHESITTAYSSAPTTWNELNSLEQI